MLTGAWLFVQIPESMFLSQFFFKSSFSFNFLRALLCIWGVFDLLSFAVEWYCLPDRCSCGCRGQLSLQRLLLRPELSHKKLHILLLKLYSRAQYSSDVKNVTLTKTAPWSFLLNRRQHWRFIGLLLLPAEFGKNIVEHKKNYMYVEIQQSLLSCIKRKLKKMTNLVFGIWTSFFFFLIRN